ncbi:MAG: hypothetical protein WBM83_05285 [Flavobacteriaceae bacterium]
MGKGKTEIYIIAACILFIVVLATFFHFEVHYENVLANLPEPEFGVQISVWRIVFEPVIGLLLFFNRSIYALKELPLALLWAAIFYFLFSLRHVVTTGEVRKKVLLKKVANIPLILGICFSIFIVLLFIPLPNNTIINQSKSSVLVTTHAHTEYSHDGLISQKGMWNWHKRNGFDAFFITDHADHKKSLDFQQAQRNDEFEKAPLVMVGQEHSGSNHMSLLGLNGRFDTKGMADKAVIDSVHKYGGIVIVNHWFDGKGKEKEFYRDLGADGFEIENVGTDLYYDRELFKELKTFCSNAGLTMVGGLDFHGYGRMCSVYNALEIPNWKTMEPLEKEQAILGVLKNGPQDKIKILMYKDRDFYTEANLVFRPFLSFVNYFRTLNVLQTISWIFWLLLLLFASKKYKRLSFDADRSIVVAAAVCTVFLLVLAGLYYYKGQVVKGYSEVYSEYFGILGVIGLILLLYVSILAYLRFFRKLISENKK